MAAATRMELLFGTTRIEVDASLAERRGGLRIIAREVEQQLGLRPNTYGFYDGSGKVDTPAALQRVVSSARGVCLLEVRESTEGKMMREMQTAMKALEDRMLAKMEERVASVRLDLETRVKSVAAEQTSLRAKIDEMLDESFAMRTDALAAEEELKERIDSLAQDCLAMRVDTLAGEQELTARLDAMVEETARDLGRDKTSGEHEEVRADVHGLDQVAQEADKDENAKKNSTEKQEVTEENRKAANVEPPKAFESAWSVPWTKMVNCPLGSVLPYSCKAPPSTSFDKKRPHAGQWDGLRPGFEAFAPFAHGPVASPTTASRFHCEGLRGLRPSRSTPLLAPLL